MDVCNKLPSIVDINVGGHIYTTSLSTLTRFSESMLGAMFSGRQSVAKDSRGNFFIDRDGAMFRYVLNFLRSARMNLPDNFQEFDQLREEADFFQIPQLIDALREAKAERTAKQSSGNSDIIRLTLDRDKHGLETLITIFAERRVLHELFPDESVHGPLTKVVFAGKQHTHAFVAFSFEKELGDPLTNVVLQEIVNRGFQVMTRLSNPEDRWINEWFFLRKDLKR